ncbi:methylated-DNA--[protein]-cysteine S-methyltransferase [Kineococcus esterisolvens]|uniref:methylated-DNA--[protein]-cysteine S-methyltransferase n=1 Tax=unclassified Kineococcus TaxID=2621656 RepID=UPI003D7E5D23
MQGRGAVDEHLPGAADEGADLAALRAALAARAAADGLLDVAYRTLDSPVGPLLLAATERGVVRVAFGREDHDAVLAALAARLSPRVLHAPARLEAAARELGEYFEGRREGFDLPLDLSLAAGFRRDVLGALRALPYGTTATYTRVAGLAGSPRAVRAVGTACARNPLPLLVPCHRVVRSDGGTGEYVGGAAAKRLLLDLESGPGSTAAGGRGMVGP